MIILPESTPEQRAAFWSTFIAACLGLMIVLLVFRDQLLVWIR